MHKVWGIALLPVTQPKPDGVTNERLRLGHLARDVHLPAAAQARHPPDEGGMVARARGPTMTTLLLVSFTLAAVAIMASVVMGVDAGARECPQLGAMRELAHAASF